MKRSTIARLPCSPTRSIMARMTMELRGVDKNNKGDQRGIGVVVPPPNGVTQEEWDTAINDAGEKGQEETRRAGLYGWRQGKRRISSATASASSATRSSIFEARRSRRGPEQLVLLEAVHQPQRGIAKGEKRLS